MNKAAGAWGTDIGRNVVGKGEAYYPNSPIGWRDTSGALYADTSNSIGNPAAPLTSSDPTILHIDASRVWGEAHTGTEFAPAHVWVPHVIYLGIPV